MLQPQQQYQDMLLRLALCVGLLACASSAQHLGCNISACISDRQVSPAYTEYHKCIANASSVQAFHCRCTLKIRDCLHHPHFGNCSWTDDYATAQCGRFLVQQDLGCSVILCEAGSSSSTTAVLTFFIAILTALLS